MKKDDEYTPIQTALENYAELYAQKAGKVALAEALRELNCSMIRYIDLCISNALKKSETNERGF